jgi:hypothetical protein
LSADVLGAINDINANPATAKKDINVIFFMFIAFVLNYFFN